MVASDTTHLASDRADHLERCAHARELLGQILAERAHCAAALRTDYVGSSTRSSRGRWLPSAVCWRLPNSALEPEPVERSRPLAHRLDFRATFRAGPTAPICDRNASAEVCRFAPSSARSPDLDQRSQDRVRQAMRRPRAVRPSGLQRHRADYRRATCREVYEHPAPFTTATPSITPLSGGAAASRYLQGPWTVEQSLNKSFRCGLRSNETPVRRPLCEQRYSVVGCPQNLDQVATAPVKDEHVTAQWILAERCLNLRRQTRKAAPHTSHACHDPHPHSRRQETHRSRIPQRQRLTNHLKARYQRTRNKLITRQ